MLFATSCGDATETTPLDGTQLVIATANGDVAFSVEWARSPQERAKGLMHRRSLPEDAGMMFDFGKQDMVSMWMRNTYIPLDMIFIDDGLVIRHIAKRTTPLSERTISSRVSVRYVLEINGGAADRRGIMVGDGVRVP